MDVLYPVLSFEGRYLIQTRHEFFVTEPIEYFYKNQWCIEVGHSVNSNRNFHEEILRKTEMADYFAKYIGFEN